MLSQIKSALLNKAPVGYIIISCFLDFLILSFITYLYFVFDTYMQVNVLCVHDMCFYCALTVIFKFMCFMHRCVIHKDNGYVLNVVFIHCCIHKTLRVFGLLRLTIFLLLLLRFLNWKLYMLKLLAYLYSLMKAKNYQGKSLWERYCLFCFVRNLFDCCWFTIVMQY